MSQNPPLSQGDLTKLLWIRTFCTKTYFLLLLCSTLPLMNSIPLVLTKSYVICSLLISSKHDLTGTSNPVMVLYHCFRKFHLALQRRNGKSNMLSKFNYLKRGLSVHLCIHSIRSLDPPDLNKYLLYFLLPRVCYITLMMLSNSEQQQ